MPIIVFSCQHCDEQHFQTRSCAHYTIFPVVKLDFFIRSLLLDQNLALEITTSTPCVHLVKSGDPSLLNNYRPISVLFIFQKKNQKLFTI